jgi:hypothetical protein
MIYKLEGKALDGAVHHINTRFVARVTALPYISDSTMMQVVIVFSSGEKISLTITGPMYDGLVRVLADEEGDQTTPRVPPRS